MRSDATTRKVALITGGGSGIGRGIALALARRGVDVALVGRRQEPLEQVARRAERFGMRALAIPADLSDVAQLDRVVGRLHAELGQVDYLVNNAGVMSGGALSSLPRAAVEATISTNLLAPVELTRLLLPDLVASRGTVIIVASSVSHAPMPYASLYSATKAGVRAFADAMRFELEPLGVRVLVAYPPATATAMVQSMAELANAIRFPLASPGAVGERIVQALMAGKNVVYAGWSEHIFSLAYRFAPALLRIAFRSQRRLFERMLSPDSGEEV